MAGEADNSCLDKLRCMKCFAPLSYPPIWQNQNGYSVCGRCPISSEERKYLSRAFAFEHLGEHFLFPCNNYHLGCEEKRSITSMKQHEENCYHRYLKCPINPTCPWVGKMHMVKIHCEQKHARENIKNPWTYLVQCQVKKLMNFMIEFGYLFLVVINIDPPNVWHNITLLIDSNVTSLFTYSIEVSCGKRRFKNVHQLNTLNKFNINQLRFKGKETAKIGKNLHLKIELHVKRVKCLLCNLYLKKGPFRETADGTFLCRDCTESPDLTLRFPMKCANPGCNRTESHYYDLLKHQIWFCRHVTDPCFDCFAPLRMESRMEHYKKCGKHPIIIPQNIGNRSATITINEYILVNNPSYMFVVNVFDKIFRICYVINPENLRVNIVADISRKATKNYVWILRICSMDPNNRNVLEKTILNETYDKEQNNVYRLDWILFLFFSYTNLQKWSFENNFIELIVKKKRP